MSGLSGLSALSGLSGVSGGVTVYNYILDRFTGANGTTLVAHPLETGEAWTARVNGLYISSNAAIPFGSGAGDSSKVSRNSVPLKSTWIDNFTVEAMFTPQNVSGYERGICVRYQDEQNYWKIRTVGTGGNGFRIIEVNGGVETLRAFANPSFSNGTPYKLRVSVIGNVITATWDTTTITFTSSFLAGQSNVAVFTTFEAAHVESIDNFLVWEGSGAPPPNPLYP